MFQHTAARRRLQMLPTILISNLTVSTHSRAEAAATATFKRHRANLSFNTQPRGGGCKMDYHIDWLTIVSTHSRAEAAAPK